MTENKIEKKIEKIIGGSKIFVDEEKCNGCGQCAEVCPFGLPKPSGSGKYEIKDSDLCIECGACLRNCENKAIIMQEQKGCGCLWDARQRLKNEKTGKIALDVCGCGAATSSCCNSENPTDVNFDIKFIKTYDQFIKPNLGSCCAPSTEEESKKTKNKIHRS